MFSSTKKIFSYAAVTSLSLIAALALPSTCFPSSAFADAKSELDAANSAASAASSAYDEALSHQEDLAAQVSAKQAEIDDMENITLPSARAQASAAVKQMYVSGTDAFQILSMICTGNSLKEVVDSVSAYEKIVRWRQDALASLKQAREDLAQAKAQLDTEKAEADAAVEAAETAKKEALDAQEAAREAYQASLPKTVPTTRRAPTADTFHDEESARAFIVKKESGGNYNARNGRYIGAYQLTDSYLGGDWSPENQDRVAQNYVDSRYGGWVGAANFWLSHGWY